MFGEVRINSIRGKTGRFSFLLLAIMLIFALRPFLEPFIHISLLSDIFFSLVMLSGINAIGYKKRDYVLSLATAIPAVVLRWTANVLHIHVVRLPATILGAVFFTLALILILSHVNRQREVTREVVMGAVCAYFLIGIVWAHVHFLLERASPGSFSLPGDRIGDQMDFLYYSFITLTTVGYGDIIPLSTPARSFAILEAMVGQLFLVVTLARLVAMHITQSHGQEK